jgi:hypothetical protein
MTKAPERIWAFYTPDDFDDSATITAYETTQYGGQEYLHTDHALALVAAALEPWVKLRDESRGVTGFHLNGNEADWDEFDLPELDDDAQAALERRDKRVWNDALREAVDAVHRECWTDGNQDQVTPELLTEQATTSLAVRAIKELITEDQSDG